ncbi:MAG: peptidase domain-containing ABC transporter [Geminicoccaceae bacterium]
MSVLDGLRLGFGRSLPMMLQTEAAECGLACLGMVLAYHGDRQDLAALRRRFGLSLKGATLGDIMVIADRLGFAGRPLRLELDDLRRLKAPCILHWDLNHFVVLKSVARGNIVIHDPSAGVRRLSFEETSKHFSGIALELSPTGSFTRSERPPRVGLRPLLGRFTGVKRALLVLFGLALAIEVFALVTPLFMQWVIDHVLVASDRELLVTLVIGFSILLLIRAAVTAVRGWMLLTLGASLRVQAQANLFSHLIRLPSAFFEARHLGDVMSRFGSQETILEAITTELVEAILDGLMTVLTLTILFIYAPSLAVLVIAAAALYGLIRWASFRPLREAEAEAISWEARRDSHFLESLRGVKTVKMFNAQQARRSQWLRFLVEALNRELAADRLALVVRIANLLILGGLTILIVWLGASRVLDSSMSVGMLIAFIAYKDQFVERVTALIDRVVELTMLRLHAERVADIALSPPEPRDGEAAPILRRERPSLEVRDLGFRYGANEPYVLEGLSFRVEAGETVAIAGPSGCGKTTLLKIMAGLLEPSGGEILIDGEPRSRLGIERFRAMTGVVMQDDQLFAGSIADNISFFADEPDQARIEQCAALAAVHDDVMAMPMGYHSLIGDMGTILSGGQKQRVLVARALYRRPGLLLLDEATSHLDVTRERQVNAAIAGLDITRIVIAHRPETLKSAGRVIDLGGGVATSLTSTAVA